MIHATAVVDPSARIADNVTIGAYSVIGADVSIGEGTVVWPHVVISGPCQIGRDNRIYSFCSIGEAPQDKKYADEPTTLVIGDRNTIRESCTLNRGTAQDRGTTTIGNDNWVMAYVHVAHDCDVADHVILANNVTLAGHVSVGEQAILGGFTKVHQFCRVGAHAFCSMNSDVNRDVPPYVTASGSMAVPRGVNSEGLKRRAFSREQIRNIRNAYKTLYRSDLKLEEALANLDELAPQQPELDILIRFVRESERSIIR